MKDANLAVAIQGIKGSNSNVALDGLVKDFGLDVEQHFTDNFGEFVGLMSSDSEIAYFFVPYLNSTGSHVHRGVVGIAEHDLSIIADHLLEVRHYLVRHVSDNNSELRGRQVSSHEQALIQCASFITESGLEGIDVGDTALAAKKLSEEEIEGYAICNELTARIYPNLEVVQEIPLEKSNVTRFLFCKKAGEGTPSSLNRDISDYRLNLVVEGSLGGENGELIRILENWGLKPGQNYPFPRKKGSGRTFGSRTFLDFAFKVREGYIIYKGKNGIVETGLPYNEFHDFIQKLPGFLGMYEMHRLNSEGQPFRNKERDKDGIAYALENPPPFDQAKFDKFNAAMSGIRGVANTKLPSPDTIYGK